MARPPKPWWNAATGEYNVNIRGIRHKLGPDKDAAETQFHTLMAAPPEERTAPDAVLVIMDEFLTWVGSHREPGTFGWYQKHCQSFTDYLKSKGKKSLLVKDLAPYHVLDWVDSHSWSDGTKNGACRAVQRAFNWALKRGRLKINPITYIDEKPSPGRRENIITIDQWKELIGLVKDESFRDLLTVTWECGCRPQESLRVERRHVHLDLRRWEFPPEEAKGKKKVRFVYLTDNSLTITKRLMARHRQGPLFRNKRGRRWTPYSVNCRFVRLKEKIGRKVALYDFRHSFTERLRQAGVDSVNIAALLGHSDLSMLGRTYAHPHTNAKSLLEELNKGIRPSGSSARSEKKASSAAPASPRSRSSRRTR
jgi:integrase